MVKTKLKPVLPTLREKKRYVVFEVISKGKISDFEKVSDAVCLSTIRFVGELGAARAGVIVLGNKWDEQTQRGIIKVIHKHVDAVKASFVFIDKIDGKDAIVRSLGVSGILRKAENNFLKTKENQGGND